MAEPLKNQYGPEVAHKLVEQILSVYPEFEGDCFLEEVLIEFESLELMPRGKHLATTLKRFLPDDYPQAIDILVRSMGDKLTNSDSFGMSPFYYLPHSFYISEYGLEHFEESMDAQYELTQRFTAEFCMRPFLLKYPQQTLARLELWLDDPSEHVRRSVSESTRPRLPWGMALKPFKEDPRPILPLLERLKDDPSLFVRRSVANNLNDIGKDNPDILCDVCRRWLKGASDERRWLVNHALRSAIKRGEADALAVLGYGADVDVSISDISITPQYAQLGDQLTVGFCIRNQAAQTQALLVDFAIHYVKANGTTSRKVFKLKTLQLESAASVKFSKKVSLKDMTTRKHYSGEHKVEALLNGVSFELGFFDLKV